MEKIYSRVDGSRLLHIVNRLGDIAGRKDLVPEDQFIQLATLSMSEGKTFRPHKHIWKNAPDKDVIAQESWVVISGSVEVYFYDIDDSLIKTCVIGPGDCSVTLEGGHNYRILEDNTIVYEYKTGPYNGQQADKVFINE